MRQGIKILLGLLLSGWLLGVELLYLQIYPLNLQAYFTYFLRQFSGYEGFNFSYLGDFFFLIISLWFALLIGYWVTQILGLRFLSLLELMVVSIGLGLFVLGMLVFFLGVIGRLYGWLINVIYLVVAPGLVLLIAGSKLKNEFLRVSHLVSSSVSGLVDLLVRKFIYLIILLVLFVGFLYTLTPPSQSDGLRYHLAAPQEYIKHHRIIYLPFNAFSNFPFLVEMLFTLGMMLWSDVLAKLFHFSFLILSGLMLVLFWRNFFQPELEASFGIRPEWLVFLIFNSTPAVLILACWEFIDLGVVFYFLALIYSLSRWLKSNVKGWLMVASIFAGAALGTKYTMLWIVILSAIWIPFYRLFFSRNRQTDEPTNRQTTKPLPAVILFLLISGCLGSPWYIKNLLNTGNPVYPFAYTVFDGGEWSKTNDEFYRDKAAEKGFPRSLRTFLTSPWDTAIYWSEFEHFNPGSIYLLFSPLVLVLGGIILFRTPRDKFLAIKTVIFFAAVYYFLWYFTYQSNRFLLPYFALCALLIVAAMVKIRDYWKPLSWLCLGLIILCSLYGSLWSVRWILTEATPHPLPVVLGFESRDKYLSKALNYYPCARWLNLKSTLHDPKSRVLFIGEHRGYYFSNVHYLASDWFDTPWIIYLIRQTKDNAELFDWLKQNDVKYVLLNLAELNLYYEDYFKSRFTEEEIKRFEDFIKSERLQRLFPPGDIQTYVCEIKW